MVTETPVSFYTHHGFKLAGGIWIPDDYRPGEKRSGIVNVQGYTTVYHLPVYVAISEALAEAGFVVLSVDFRGYGKSEAPGGVGSKDVTMMQEVEDVMNAITYLRTRPEVNPRSIGLVGNSLGGALVVYTAAFDKRAKAVISNWGIGDCERWLRSLSRLPEWRDMMEELEEQRKERVQTGKSKYVNYMSYMKLAGEEASEITTWERNGHIGVNVPPSFIESVMMFKPELVVDQVSPSPILFVHPECEEAVTFEESISMYRKAKDPKELLVLPIELISNHIQFENDFRGKYKKAFDDLMAKEVDFLKKSLPPP